MAKNSDDETGGVDRVQSLRQFRALLSAGMHATGN